MGAESHADHSSYAATMPGLRGVAERELLELRDAALAAVLDALSWMDPATAAKWRAEASYKRLAAMLPSTSLAADEEQR
jgi:hypothetical protein